MVPVDCFNKVSSIILILLANILSWGEEIEKQKQVWLKKQKTTDKNFEMAVKSKDMNINVSWKSEVSQAAGGRVNFSWERGRAIVFHMPARLFIP